MDSLSVTNVIIAINVICYFLDAATTRYVIFPSGLAARYQPMYELGAFTPQAAIIRGQIWRFLTFQFLHANLTHLVFNMLALLFFGPPVEAYLGKARFLLFYLLCGIAGPISYLFFILLGIVPATRSSGLIGASAGVFGVLIAAAQVLPDAKVLIYGLIPARVRTVAWVLLGIAIYTVFTNGRNAGGEAAHLGGAAVGYLLIRNGWISPVEHEG
jgi:membrane associated rhomboid family serine protease